MHEQRNDNLQILRFLASAIVLLTHLTFYIHERVDASFAIWHPGEAGVPMFFVISGFVMVLSGARLPRNLDGARTFMHRRLSRILPLYWLLTTVKIVLALAIPAVVLHNHPDLLRALGSYLLIPMLNDAGQLCPLHCVAWTLLHEMFFYYLFALAMALGLRLSPPVFSSVVLLVLWAIGLDVAHDTAFKQVVFHQHNLMFVVGMALAAAYQRGIRLPVWLAVPLLVAAVVSMIGVDMGYASAKAIREYNVDAAIIVIAFLFIGLDAFAALKRRLVSLGDSSYSLYMLHPILGPAVCVGLMHLGVTSAVPMLVLGLVICIGLSSLAYRLIERPLNERAKTALAKLLLKPAQPIAA
jgi:exopolysaccharide production protein ExoZ